MSYNYLPLDRKWLSFQQVKNLLDFDQLVSITFDAHERILKSSHFLNKSQQKERGQIDHQQNEQEQLNLLINNAFGIGEEAPDAIVKLMLMLKIKSLSFGHSDVQIETVKRLMELYNNAVLPVVFMRGGTGVNGDSAFLSQLSLPLIGLGTVDYEGEKRTAKDVFTQLNWQPIKLKSNEAMSLISGTQFTSACGLYALKKTEQLLKFANAIAALSYSAFDCNIDSLHKNLYTNNTKNGTSDVAETLLRYLKEAGKADGRSIAASPYSFRCVPQVHGAAKDAYDYVLNIFLQEINSVSENTGVFPDENLVLNSGSFHGQPLAIALDFLCLSLTAIANISVSRTNLLADVNPPEKSGGGLSIGAGIVDEVKQLAAPSSINNTRLNNEEDYISMSANAANKSLQLVDRVEEVLAVELILAAEVIDSKRSIPAVGTLQKLMQHFTQKVSFFDENLILKNDLNNAVVFLRDYKF